jgi:hypothetical protein
MEESPDFMKIFIEWRFEIVLTVGRCLDRLDMTVLIVGRCLHSLRSVDMTTIIGELRST